MLVEREVRSSQMEGIRGASFVEKLKRQEALKGVVDAASSYELRQDSAMIDQVRENSRMNLDEQLCSLDSEIS